VGHPSGTASRNRIIQLRSPTQNVRSDKQREQKTKAVQEALRKFYPQSMGPSLARVARAARKVDAKPLRAEKRRRRAEEEFDDGEAMLNMPDRRAARL
jgi:hypothetical protein